MGKRIQILVIVGGLCIGALIPLAVVKVWMFSSQPQVEVGDYRKVVYDFEHELILFTKTSCEFCKLEKQYLADNNTAYKEIVVDKDPMSHDYFHNLGENGVPVLISRTKKLVGYHASSLDDYFEWD